MEIPLTFAAFKGKRRDKVLIALLLYYIAKHRRSLTDLVRKGRVRCDCATSPCIYTPHHCDQYLEARLGQSFHQGLTYLPPASVCTLPKLLLHNLV